VLSTSEDDDWGEKLTPAIQLLQLLAEGNKEQFDRSYEAFYAETMNNKAQQLAKFTGHDADTLRALIEKAASGDSDAKEELQTIKESAKKKRCSAKWEHKAQRAEKKARKLSEVTGSDIDDVHHHRGHHGKGGKGAWAFFGKGFMYGKGFAAGKGLGKGGKGHHHHGAGPLVRKLMQLSDMDCEEAKATIHGAKQGDNDMCMKINCVLDGSSDDASTDEEHEHHPHHEKMMVLLKMLASGDPLDFHFKCGHKGKGKGKGHHRHSCGKGGHGRGHHHGEKREECDEESPHYEEPQGLSQLLSMGFCRDDAMRALIAADQDADDALAMLLCE